MDIGALQAALRVSEDLTSAVERALPAYRIDAESSVVCNAEERIDVAGMELDALRLFFSAVQNNDSAALPVLAQAVLAIQSRG